MIGYTLNSFDHAINTQRVMKLLNMWLYAVFCYFCFRQVSVLF